MKSTGQREWEPVYVTALPLSCVSETSPLFASWVCHVDRAFKLSSASCLLARQSKSTELVIKGKSHHFIGEQNSLPYTYDNSNLTIDKTPTVLNAFFNTQYN